MTWAVEARETGRYEAIVHYTCPAEDVGAEIELRLGETVWKGRIIASHDPSLKGMENDRVRRGSESYVKDFLPVSLGEGEVAAGKTTLELRATRVPGRQVADVRAVELRRIGPKR